MSSKPPLDDYVAQVKQIDWMSAPSPTPEAEALLREYARRVGIIARHFRATRGWTLVDADTHMVGVGMKTPESDRLIAALFRAISGVRVKEHLVFNLHANYFWDTDPELARFQNPFTPLVDLYRRGYTTAGGVADDGSARLEMTLGSQQGVKEYAFDVDMEGR